MKYFLFILSLLFLNILTDITPTFDEAISNLEILESYITDYKQSSGDSTSLDQLLLSYIRTSKYTGTAWSIVAGSCPDALITYITQLDNEHQTKISEMRSYGEIETPTKEKIDFVHFFAVMNGLEYLNSFTAEGSGLVGWAGDLAQLFQDISSISGTVEELVNEARNYLGIKGQFGPADLVSDLDAVSVWNKRLQSSDNSYAKIMKEYYENAEMYGKRVVNFLQVTFPNLDEFDKNKFREVVYSSYSGNSLIKRLECTYGLRSYFISCTLFPGDLKSEYVNHPTAVSYALADYLYEKINDYIKNYA